MCRQTDYSDGDDSSDNNNPIRNTPTLTIATSKSRNNRNSIGPLLPHIEQKLATLLMPKLINDKLSPSGMSPVTIGNLIHKFGLHAPALYQMIRLMKWEIFFSNPTSDYVIIEQFIISVLKRHFQLDSDYITGFLKAPMISTKDSTRVRTLSESLNRMFIDYRNDQLMGWHKCIKHPTRQFLRGALGSYFFSNSQATSYCDGTLIPMGNDEAESVLTIINT